MPGRLTTTRVATNVSGGGCATTSTCHCSRRQHASRCRRGGSTSANGASAELDITIESTADDRAAVRRDRLLTPNNAVYPTLHLPVAFVTQQGDVELTQDVQSDGDPARQHDDCARSTATNTRANAAEVDLTTSTNRNLTLTQAIGATLVGGEARLTAELAGDRPGRPVGRSGRARPASSRSPPSASPRSPSATRTSSTSTSRRSSTTAGPTPASASTPTATSSPVGGRPRTTTAATCPPGPTRHGRTTSWRRSGPTSTARVPTGSVSPRCRADRRRRQRLDRRRVERQRVRHGRHTRASRRGSE